MEETSEPIYFGVVELNQRLFVNNERKNEIMLMIPSLFQDTIDFFDDGFGGAWFNTPSFDNIERKLYSRKARNRMCTDIKETDTDYEMIVDLPGFKKEDVSIKLEKGYITISASKCMGEGKDERETNPKSGLKPNPNASYQSEANAIAGSYSKKAVEEGMIVNSRNDVTRDRIPPIDADRRINERADIKAEPMGRAEEGQQVYSRIEEPYRNTWNDTRPEKTPMAEHKDMIKDVPKNMSKTEEESCKYLCRERYCGECSRTFYVGEDITQNDIKAKFEHGILTLHFPKKDQKKTETCKYIEIEG